MDAIDIQALLSVLIAGISALLIYISGVSYRVTGNRKVLFLLLSFVFFLIKGLWLVAESASGNNLLEPYPLLFVTDLLILVMMYVSVASK